MMIYDLSRMIFHDEIAVSFGQRLVRVLEFKKNKTNGIQRTKSVASFQDPLHFPVSCAIIDAQ